MGKGDIMLVAVLFYISDILFLGASDFLTFYHEDKLETGISLRLGLDGDRILVGDWGLVGDWVIKTVRLLYLT